MTSDQLVLGVDVGGTKIAVGAVRGATVSDLFDYIKLLLIFDALFVLGGAAIFGTVVDA